MQWPEHGLFYDDSIRFSSAMAGADYGVFANGDGLWRKICKKW
jgi:hypothetical protein